MATRIIVSVVLAPLFFIVLFFLPPVWLTVVVAGIVALASYELLKATKAADNALIYVCTAVAAAAIPFSHLMGVDVMVTEIAALLLMVTAFFEAIHRYDSDRAVPAEHILFCGLRHATYAPYSDSLSLRIRNFYSLTSLHTVTRRFILQKTRHYPYGL